jgi:MFS family permease
MNGARRRVITRTVWLLSAVSLFNDVASELLYPVMPVYLKSIGFSFFLIGLLEGIAEAVAGLGKGTFGHWSDLAGRRMPFVRTGYALSAAARGILALFASTVPVFIARVTDRFGKGVRTTARDALLAHESTPDTRARVFGLHRAMDTAGAVLGPALALWYLQVHPGHYREVIAIAVLPGLVALAVTFLVREPRAATAVKARPGLFSFFGYWKTAGGTYRRVLAGLTAFALVNSSDVFLLLAVKERGFSDAQMISAYIFYNMFYAALAWPVGRLADRVGLKRVLVAGLAAFVVVYAFVGFAASMFAFAGLFVLYALFAACFEPMSRAFISNLSPESDRGRALGLYNSLTSLAAIVAGIWTGGVWMTLGPAWAFGISAAGTSAVLLFLIRHRGAERPPVSEPRTGHRP